MSNELGIDRSGNGNNWTVNNITYSDQVVDSPTNNFCTMNPLEGSANGTYSEGNLRIQTPNYPFGKGTFHVSAGKWYWEWTHHSGTYNTYTGIGNDLRVATAETHNTANTQAWLGNAAALKKWSSTSGYDAGTLAINDIIGIAVDLDNGSIKFYINILNNITEWQNVIGYVPQDIYLMDDTIKNNILILDSLPIKIEKLFDIINIQLIKQKYNFQSNFQIKDYTLNLNSRVIANKEIKLKLTEREIDIILFLKEKNSPQSINMLQNVVWGHSFNLETHTVETHIYRLRKKIKDKFNDEKFIISYDEGYLI